MAQISFAERHGRSWTTLVFLWTLSVTPAIDAVCLTASDAAANMASGCCVFTGGGTLLTEGVPVHARTTSVAETIAAVKVDSGWRYNHKFDRKYAGGVTGVDNTACGATWAAPCLSIKYAWANRIDARAGVATKVLLAPNGYFSGADNRDIRIVASGASTAGWNPCDHFGDNTFESADKTTRPMIDMEFKDRFIQMGGWTDLNYGCGGYNCMAGKNGVLNIKNVAFMRGSAPAPNWDPTKGQDFSMDNTAPGISGGFYSSGTTVPTGAATAAQMKLVQKCTPLSPTGSNLGYNEWYGGKPWWVPACGCNVSDPAEFDSAFYECKVGVLPKLGFGGVLSIWDDVDGNAKTTLTNVDFSKNQALMGGAIGMVGGHLELIGEPVLLSASQVGALNGWGVPGTVGEQAPMDVPIDSGAWVQNPQHPTEEPWRGSYCNFVQNNAWGNPADGGAGGAIYLFPVAPQYGGGSKPKVTVTGCNFWRNYAYNPWQDKFGNGGVIGGLWVGYLNADNGAPFTNPVPEFTFTRVTFYENVAARGSVFWAAPNRGVAGGYSGAPSTANPQYWRMTGHKLYMTDVYAARNGYYDEAAVRGVIRQEIAYAYGLPQEFRRQLATTFGNQSAGTVYHPDYCRAANSTSEAPRCAHKTDPTGSPPVDGPAGECIQGVTAGGCDCGTQTLTKLACESGMAGVFRTNSDPDLRWPVNPRALDWPETPAGNMPEENYACQGWDQYGDNAFPGSKYASSHPTMEAGNKYYANCKSAGKYTPLFLNYGPGSGSDINGVVCQHGGVYFSRGSPDRTVLVKDSKFVQNAVAGNGGVFYMTSKLAFISGTFRFENTEFIRNRARSGGAIQWAGLQMPTAQPKQFIDAPNPNNKLVLVDCKFIANIAKWDGGAISAPMPNFELADIDTKSEPATVLVRPPACTGTQLNSAYQCQPITMGTHGVYYYPYGSKVVVEAYASTRVGNASSLTSSSASAFMWNIAGLRAGVFSLQATTDSQRPSYNISWVINVTDTYIANNGVRLEPFPDVAADYENPNLDNGAMTGDGGVIHLQPDMKKRSAGCGTCSVTQSSGYLGCPTGSQGTCKCYDACAYENYVIGADVGTGDNECTDCKIPYVDLASIHFREDTSIITFTHCRIDSNVARYRGGVIYVHQVLRDAANITFDTCDMNKNLAFVKGSILHSADFQNFKGLYPQWQAIRTGQDVWVGETKFINTDVRDSSCGFYGALYIENSYRVVFEDSRVSNTHSTWLSNDTHWKSTAMSICPNGYLTNKSVTHNVAKYGKKKWTCGNSALTGQPITDEYMMLYNAFVESTFFLAGQTTTNGGLFTVGGARVVAVTIEARRSTFDGQQAGLGGFMSQLLADAMQSTCTTPNTNCSGSYPAGGIGAIALPNCPDVASTYRCPGKRMVKDVEVTGTSSVVLDFEDSVVSRSAAIRGVASDGPAGGAFMIVNSITLYAVDSVFSKSYAQGPGGFMYSSTNYVPQQVVLHSSVVEQNSCELQGGVYGLGSSSTIHNYNSTYRRNYMLKGDGGAIAYLLGKAKITFDGGTIEENFSARHTAGIWLAEDAQASLTGTTVRNNYASWYAGIFFTTYSSKVTLTDCSFENNRALGYDGRGGGVMLLMFFSTAEITRCTFTENYAFHDGGAIQLRGSPTLKIVDSSFNGNSAGEDGGALYIEHDFGADWNTTAPDAKNSWANSPVLDDAGSPLVATVTVKGTTFTGNSAGEHGGAIACGNQYVFFDNCSGTGNTAEIGGGFGAILHVNGSIWMRGLSHGSVLSNNAAMQAGGAFYSRGIQEGDPSRVANSTKYITGPDRDVLETQLNHFYSFDRQPAPTLGNTSRTCPPHIPNTAYCVGGMIKLEKMVLEDNSAQYWGGAFAYDRVPLKASVSESTAQRNFAGIGSVAAFMYNSSSELLDVLQVSASRRSASSTTAAMLQASKDRIFMKDGPKLKRSASAPDEPFTKGNMATIHDHDNTWKTRKNKTNHMEKYGFSCTTTDGIKLCVQSDLSDDGNTMSAYSSLPAAMNLNAPGIHNWKGGFIPGMAYDNVYGSNGEDMDALSFEVRDAFDQTIYIANNTFCLLRATVAKTSTNLYGHQPPCALVTESTLNTPGCIKAPTLAGVLDSTSAAGKNKFKAIQFTSYFDSALDLNIDCAHRWALSAMPSEMMNFGDISVSPVKAYAQILARDCPKGWQPIAANTQALYSQKMFVAMCSPCPAGTFSPAANAQCQGCPGGASSSKGAFGISDCFCADGEYIKAWEYVGVDPAMSGMTCSKCKETCSKGPIIGGGFAGANCNKCKPWTSAGPNRYPMAIVNAWAGTCRKGGECKPLPVSMWDSSTMVHKCPYGKKACPGDYNKDAWSTEWRVWGDVRRANPVATQPPECDMKGAESVSRCCPANTLVGNPITDEQTGTKLEANKTCYWGKAVGSVCAAGYKGPVCAVCADGYSFSGKSCLKCDGFAFNFLFISFILIIVLVAYEVVGKVARMQTKKDAAQSKNLSLLMKKKKILARTKACVAQVMVIVSFAQVLCTFGDTLSIEFPTAFDDLSGSLSFLNFDMVNVMSALCYYKADYYDTLQVQFWWPTILILLLILDYCRERKTDPDDEYAGVSQIKAIVIVLFTAYPLSAVIFCKFFLCREIDGEWFLQADYRYQCFDDKWNSYLALSIPGVVIYLIGSPLYFVLIMWHHKRNGTLLHPVTEDKYSFLFIKFKGEYWYFESYCLMVKLCLCGIVMFVLKGSATQVTVCLVLATVFLIVSLNTAPFKNNDMNSGEMLTRSATMVTLFMALLLKVKLYDIDEWSEGILTGILMLVNMVVMVLFTYRFIRVQGNFLCANYFPEFCNHMCIACNRAVGWKEDVTASTSKPKTVDDEQNPLLSVISLKKPTNYQQRTFKCVS